MFQEVSELPESDPLQLEDPLEVDDNGEETDESPGGELMPPYCAKWEAKDPEQDPAMETEVDPLASSGAPGTGFHRRGIPRLLKGMNIPRIFMLHLQSLFSVPPKPFCNSSSAGRHI